MSSGMNTISSRLRFSAMYEGLLFQDGNTVYQTSTVYNNHLTARQIYPVPPQAVVVEYTRGQLEHQCKPISAAMYARVTAMWDEREAVQV